MKRSAVLFLLLLSSLAFADVRLLPLSEEKVFVTLQDSLTFTAGRGLEGNQQFAATEVAVDLYPFSFAAGFQTGGQTFDSVSSISYFPFYSLRETSSWHFGFETIHHFQDYRGISNEHDLVYYFCVRWLWYSGFQLDIKTGGHFKSSAVYALDETLYNNNPALYVGVSRLFDCGLELYSSACSHDTFRYQLFLEPHWIFGLGWHFPHDISAACELELVNTDFIATSFYLNTAEVRLVGRVQL